MLVPRHARHARAHTGAFNAPVCHDQRAAWRAVEHDTLTVGGEAQAHTKCACHAPSGRARVAGTKHACVGLRARPVVCAVIYGCIAVTRVRVSNSVL